MLVLGTSKKQLMKLVDFYIENKNRIILHFEDGSSREATAGQLRQFLKGGDLDKVRQALKLKSAYLKRFPDWLKVWAVSAGALVVLAASTRAANTWRRPKVAERTELPKVTMTQSANQAAPSSAAVEQPPAKPAAPPAANNTNHSVPAQNSIASKKSYGNRLLHKSTTVILKFKQRARG
jgi:hypothetical protein